MNLNSIKDDPLALQEALKKTEREKGLEATLDLCREIFSWYSLEEKGWKRLPSTDPLMRSGHWEIVWDIGERWVNACEGSQDSSLACLARLAANALVLIAPFSGRCADCGAICYEGRPPGEKEGPLCPETKAPVSLPPIPNPAELYVKALQVWHPKWWFWLWGEAGCTQRQKKDGRVYMFKWSGRFPVIFRDGTIKLSGYGRDALPEVPEKP